MANPNAMLMLEPRSGRVQHASVEAAAVRAIIASCSQCGRGLGAVYYVCLTCRPALVRICDDCEADLDLFHDEMGEDNPPFHDPDHLWIKYR